MRLWAALIANPQKIPKTVAIPNVIKKPANSKPAVLLYIEVPYRSVFSNRTELFCLVTITIDVIMIETNGKKILHKAGVKFRRTATKSCSVGVEGD